MRTICIVGMFLVGLSLNSLAAGQEHDPADDIGSKPNHRWRIRKKDKGIELEINATGLKLTGKLFFYKDVDGAYVLEPEKTITNMKGRILVTGTTNRPVHKFYLAKIHPNNYALLLLRGIYKTGRTSVRDDDDILIVRRVVDMAKDQVNFNAKSLLLAEPCDEIPDDDVMTEEDMDEMFEPDPEA